MAEAWLEAAEAIMFGAVDDLLHQTGVSAKDIGVLVVNCSLFNPTSSLSAIAANHYKLHCSRQHHQLQPGQDGLQRRLALHRTRQLSLPDGQRGDPAVQQAIEEEEIKYELVYTVRTHKGSNGSRKMAMALAGNALKMNIATLCPLVLPLSEQLLLFASTLIGKKLAQAIFSRKSGVSAAAHPIIAIFPHEFDTGRRSPSPRASLAPPAAPPTIAIFPCKSVQRQLPLPRAREDEARPVSLTGRPPLRRLAAAGARLVLGLCWCAGLLLGLRRERYKEV
uniref:FAE domain-containing protein n=1 Tax=Oryza nivara TaxID=4536 RepID=A0A0E0IJ68_ORYNI